MHVDNPPVETQSDEQKPEASAAPAQPGWRTALEPWWNAFLQTFPIFLGTRILFILLTYFGVVLFNIRNYSTQKLTPHFVIYSWYHWDVVRFAAIAANGYKTFDNTAFFPLFPWLEHFAHTFLHKDYFLCGMLIANLAFVGMLIVLYRFVEVEFDEEIARRTSLYTAVFPTAFFFFAAYNESLFMFFMLASFYALRRGSWWLAGLLGGLATLTRSIGLLMFAIFLYEFVRQVFPRLRLAWQEQRRGDVLKMLSGLPAAALIPLGLGIFSYYLYKHFRDPLAFTHSQVNWHLGPTFPWVALGASFRQLFTVTPFTFATPHIMIDLTAAFLFAILLILCFVGPERFAISQWSLVLFGVVALVYPLLFPGNPGPHGIPYDPLPSMQRYVLEIFAGFILLAKLGRRYWFHHLYLLFALPMLAFLVLQFLTGHWTI